MGAALKPADDMTPIPDEGPREAAAHQRRIPLVFDDASLDHALSRVEALMSSDSEADRLERRALTLMIEDFERTHAPDFTASPVDALGFYMERHGLSQKQMAERAGLPASRISEFLSGKRDLNVEHVRRFHAMGIPLETLIADPVEARADFQDTRDIA